MNHDSSNRYGGFVSQIEAQFVFSDAILAAYSDAGYAVWEFPQNQAVKSLVNGDRLQWLKERHQVGPSLETILAQPPVAVLKPGTEYVVMPKGFGQKNGSTNGNGKGNGMIIQHGEIRFSAYNFIVGTESIFVMNALTQIPAELGFPEYYDALAKLKLVVHEKKRRR